MEPFLIFQSFTKSVLCFSTDHFFRNNDVSSGEKFISESVFNPVSVFGPTATFRRLVLYIHCRSSIRPFVRLFVCYQLSSETNHRISLIFCIQLAFSKSKNVTKPDFQKILFGQNFPKFNRAPEAHQFFFSYLNLVP